MTLDELKALGVDVSKLSHMGSMNYILQVWRTYDENNEEVNIAYDQYQPRRNRIWHGFNDISEDDIKRDIAETIERMKIAQIQLQEFLDGKRDTVYYWEPDDESNLRFKNKIE